MAGRLNEMNLPRFPLLPNDEVQALLVQAKAGDEAARERIINCNLRLVFNLIQRFSNRGYDMEDLFQIGTIGLIKAIDKFDLSYQVRFSTYAVPMVIGEIRRFLRDDGPMKISRIFKGNWYSHPVYPRAVNQGTGTGAKAVRSSGKIGIDTGTTDRGYGSHPISDIHP